MYSRTSGLRGKKSNDTLDPDINDTRCIRAAGPVTGRKERFHAGRRCSKRLLATGIRNNASRIVANFSIVPMDFVAYSVSEGGGRARNSSPKSFGWLANVAIKIS